MRVATGFRFVAILASAAALPLSAATALAQVSGGAAATKPGAIEHQMTKPEFKRGSAMELPKRSRTPPPKSSVPAATTKPTAPDAGKEPRK